MKIILLKPGIQCTVQDLGRWNHLSFGVPISGVMDRASAIRANLALGNSIRSAVLEFTYGNAEFIGLDDLILAYSGKGSAIHVQNILMPQGKAFKVNKDIPIKIMNPNQGIRTYIAVVGGWATEEVLGSQSTYLPAGLGGMGGRALKKGDEIGNRETYNPAQSDYFHKIFEGGRNLASWGIPEWIDWKSRSEIRVVLGPESHWFEKDSIANFFSVGYRIGNESDRMGMSLEGIKMNRIQTQELISTGTLPGTIQVKGDGNMVLLMVDGQTTGGYPRMAQVIWVDMPICAQLRPMDQVYFKEISRKEAERLYIEQENHISKIYESVLLKF